MEYKTGLKPLILTTMFYVEESVLIVQMFKMSLQCNYGISSLRLSTYISKFDFDFQIILNLSIYHQTRPNHEILMMLAWLSVL